MSIFSRLFGANSQETRAITKDNCPFGDVIYGHGGGRRKALAIPSVYAAVTNVADTLATLELPVYQWDDVNGATVDYQRPLYRLLNVAPNPTQTAKTFRFVMAVDLQTEGEYICEVVRDGIDGTPLELHRIDPARVQTQWASDYRTLNYFVDGKPFDSRYLMHIVHISLCGYRGVSPFDLCKDSLELTEYMNSFGKSFFKNAARPSGFLTTPTGLRPEEVESARRQWNDSFGGVENVGKTPALKDGYAWNKVSVDPEEGQYSESRVQQLRECQRITRTPPTISNDYERQIYANIQYSRMDYVQNTIRPLAVAIEQAIGKHLLPADTDLYVEHTIEDLLRGSFTEQIAAVTEACGGPVLTPNEGREILGYGTHQDGDRLNSPQLKVPAQSPNGKESNGIPVDQNQPQ